MYFFFFFPVGTDSRPQRRPIATGLALAAFLGVFALRWARPELFADLVRASFRPAHPTLGGALLSLFLHAGWAHLLGNGLYLAIFGRQLEGRLGWARFAALFLGGGVAACWTQAALTAPGSRAWDLPLIGASGSVAAVLGATIVRFPHRRVRVLWFLFAFLGGVTRGGVARVNALLACGLWFVLQVVQGFVARVGGGTAVAYGAHAGGFLAGVAFAFALGLHRGPRREIHRDRAERHFRRGDWYAAAGEFTTHLEIVPGDTEARRRRARCYVLLGRTGEAAAEYLRLFREARRAGHVDATASLYGEMRLYGVGTNLPERALLRLAFEFQKADHPAEAAEVYRELLNGFPEGEVSALAAIRRAELLWSKLGRAEEARRVYRELLASGRPSEWRDLASARLGAMSALAGERTAAGPAASPPLSEPAPPGGRG